MNRRRPGDRVQMPAGTLADGRIMSRLAGLAIAGALMIGVAPAGAAPSRATQEVTGSATHLGADPPYPRITVVIKASSNADGSHPRGRLTLQSPDLGQRRRGTVTCLEVQGNTATVGIRIVSAEDPAIVGKGELFKVVDNGDSNDQIAGYAITDTPPTECSPLPFSVSVVSGNYHINDEVP